MFWVELLRGKTWTQHLVSVIKIVYGVVYVSVYNRKINWLKKYCCCFFLIILRVKLCLSYRIPAQNTNVCSAFEWFVMQFLTTGYRLISSM